MSDHRSVRRPSSRRWALQVVLALVAAVALVGCDNTTPTHPLYEDFSGTWLATISVVGGSEFPVTFTLTQSGADLSGTFNGAGGQINGTIAGTVYRDTATFSITQGPPCPGSFEGSTTLHADGHMEGGYSGTGCSGPLTAEMTATRG